MTLSTINISARDHQIAKLSAIAIALSLIEFFFPSPIPGVKPGIANIIIFASTYTSKMIAARLSAKLKAGIISNVISLPSNTSPITIKRKSIASI